MNTNLNHILEARDRRNACRSKLLVENKIGVSIMLNIPGVQKTTVAYIKLFDDIFHHVKRCLKNYNTLSYEHCAYPITGPEGLMVLEGNAKDIKVLMMAIENEHPMGRLVDLDVYEKHNVPISRSIFKEPERKCYLCDRPAKVCSRSKRHSLHLIKKHIQEMLENN